ncbi:MAG: hypothetical protein PHR30_18420, partial [Gallionellaceae bacterium]|nr:hypothetical protein [Gallionellaceae bacterium]
LAFASDLVLLNRGNAFSVIGPGTINRIDNGAGVSDGTVIRLFAPVGTPGFVIANAGAAHSGTLHAILTASGADTTVGPGQCMTLIFAGVANGWLEASMDRPAPPVFSPLLAIKSDTFTMSSATWADIPGLGLSASMPVGANTAFLEMFVNGCGDGAAYGNLRFVVDGVPVGVGTGTGSRIPVSARLAPDNDNFTINSVSAKAAYAPGDHAPHAYSVQIMNPTAPAAVHINRSSDDGNNAIQARAISTLSVQFYF